MGEQPLIPNGCCNLSSINLSEYVFLPFTDKAEIDYPALAGDLEHIVRVMDDVIDENKDRHALPEQKEMALKYRNVGIGIMGLHDMLIKLGLRYGSPEAVETCKRLMRFLFRNALYASVDLAEERGSFPGYDACIWDSDIIKNSFTTDEINELKERDKLRNCSLLTIAPTGSIATALGVSTGAEPLFSLKYTRRTVSLNGGKESYYTVNAKVLDEYQKALNTTDVPDIFNTAPEINYDERIKMQAALQNSCDTAISSTLNLPETTKPEDIERIYKIAWEYGLKGVTCFVAGSREAILSNGVKSKSVQVAVAPKRPKRLPCDIHKIKVKGENFLVCVGLYENKPYEIFVYRISNIGKISNKGEIIKRKKGVYSLLSADLSIDNLLDTAINIEEKAATLYSSMLLRHGINIRYIIKTAKKVDDNISSFSSAMCRVLSTYIPIITEGKCPECGSDLIREGGCTHCSNCSYSVCG